jgi:hypothetical protein
MRVSNQRVRKADRSAVQGVVIASGGRFYQIDLIIYTSRIYRTETYRRLKESISGTPRRVLCLLRLRIGADEAHCGDIKSESRYFQSDKSHANLPPSLTIWDRSIKYDCTRICIHNHLGEWPHGWWFVRLIGLQLGRGRRVSDDRQPL